MRNLKIDSAPNAIIPNSSIPIEINPSLFLLSQVCPFEKNMFDGMGKLFLSNIDESN
ncbi:MAG: hypothetical protein MZV64_40255 [Ignavibacteriales bacterium]|nr:hypothetical protein [Ignavibacteriales bacterium]